MLTESCNPGVLGEQSFPELQVPSFSDFNFWILNGDENVLLYDSTIPLLV